MKRASASPGASPAELRIIGGAMRGRKIEYHGDPRTRPMKDRVREAVFNLIDPEGTYAIDLFAGTGALALEAISRGATGALFIERHFPTARLVEQNAKQLEITEQCRVFAGSSFVWARKADAPQELPWLVFCSPPYEFYLSRQAEMIDLLERILAAAPQGSTLVVECDERFDPQLLPQAHCWDVRVYPPAVICVLRDLQRE